ncbi:hypothetical protein GCM10020254_27520 [Streptomyces goshikiensis]
MHPTGYGAAPKRAATAGSSRATGRSRRTSTHRSCAFATRTSATPGTSPAASRAATSRVTWDWSAHMTGTWVSARSASSACCPWTCPPPE